jgi:imidazolonepropionase-like amidohydrolase
VKTPRFPLVALLCLAGLSVHAAAEQAFTAMLAWPNGYMENAHGLWLSLVFGRDRALAAVTLDAAEIAGVGEQLGSLSIGKHATLFVADGHPFDLPTRVEQAYVRGRAIDLRSKHSELAAKYRARYRQLRGK